MTDTHLTCTIGVTTNNATTSNRESNSDRIVVKTDKSSRIDTVIFETCEDDDEENHDPVLCTVFKQPCHGFSVHTGRSQQWLLWNEPDFRNLQFYSEKPNIPSMQHYKWFGDDFDIQQIILYKYWGRVVGITINATILSNKDEEIINDIHQVSREAVVASSSSDLVETATEDEDDEECENDEWTSFNNVTFFVEILFLILAIAVTIALIYLMDENDKKENV